MKILSLGSLNLDHVYSVDHFVRGGETIASKGMQVFCGGKGLNQSVALAKAGARVCHAGKIGEDGDALRRRLEENGVDTANTLVEPGVPTGHAVIQVDPSGQNCIIIHGGANQAITPAFIDEVVAKFEPGDIALFQNEISNLDYALEACAKKGLRVALNPSPIDAQLKSSPALQYVTWFILNEIEGGEITGESDPDAICDALLARYPGCAVVLTLGEKGAVYRDGNLRASFGIYKVPVVDTTAAGDTFTGYFLASVARGCDVKTALALASKASAIAVSRAGASDSIPTLAQVEAFDAPLA